VKYPKNFLLISALFACESFAAGNTLPAKILSIETRQSGLHAIFINSSVPNEGCSLQDRAILVESDPSAKIMYATLLMAAAANYDVVIRVNGCSPIDNPNSTGLQSPRIIKIQPYMQ
jgi:hypothetical protein